MNSTPVGKFRARAGTHTPNNFAYHPGLRVAVAEPVRECVQGASVLVGVRSVRVKLSRKAGEKERGSPPPPCAAAYYC